MLHQPFISTLYTQCVKMIGFIKGIYLWVTLACRVVIQNITYSYNMLNSQCTIWKNCQTLFTLVFFHQGYIVNFCRVSQQPEVLPSLKIYCNTNWLQQSWWLVNMRLFYVKRLKGRKAERGTRISDSKYKSWVRYFLQTIYSMPNLFCNCDYLYCNSTRQASELSHPRHLKWGRFKHFAK